MMDEGTKSSFYGKEFFSYVERIEKRSEDGTVCFFKHTRKDFTRYTVHGKISIYLLSSLNPSLENDVSLETYEVFKRKRQMQSLSFSQRRFEKIIQQIFSSSTITKIRRVDLYVKTDDNIWGVDISATRGNVVAFQDYLFKGDDTHSDPSLMCVLYKSTSTPIILCVGVVRTSLSEMYTCEFSDNDEFTNLEATIIQLNVTECLYKTCTNSYLNEKLQNCLKKTQCSAENLDENVSNFRPEVMLKKLLKNGINEAKEMIENKEEWECLGHCIERLNLFEDESNYGFYHLKKFPHSRFMKLDSSVVRSLQMLPLPSLNMKNESLFHLLNLCVTKMGSRRLNHWVRQPLVHRVKIQERLEIVDCFFNDPVLLEKVKKSLKLCPDLDRLMKNLQTEKATLMDLVKLYQFICTFEDIHKALREYEGINESILQERYVNEFEYLDKKFQKYCKFIEDIIDIQKVLDDKEYLINPKFDPKLKVLNEKIVMLRKKIDTYSRKIRRKYNLDEKHVKVARVKGMEEDGYCICVSGKSRKLLKKKKDIIEKKVTKYVVYITTNSLQNIAFEHQDTYGEYLVQQSEVKEKVIEVAKSYLELVEKLVHIVAELDILTAFAVVSNKNDYCKPKILEKENDLIDIKKGRHPLIQSYQTDKEFIPNDLIMKKDDGRFLVITGPNMGGKSTYIKQCALIVLMAQIGCFVPAESATISIRDGVFARIGAFDFLQRGASTFMCEMVETATILKSATKHSMIIIDELGRGTSTYDGFGLAWSISENILKKGSFCIFATHFHELSGLELNHKKIVKNFHVAVNESKTEDGERRLTMLYQLQKGHTGESFGIEVAKLVNFPKVVINKAKRKVDQLTHYQEDKKDAEPPRKKRKLSNEDEGMMDIGDDFNVDCSDFVDDVLDDFKNIVFEGDVEMKRKKFVYFRNSKLEKLKNLDCKKRSYLDNLIKNMNGNSFL